MVRHRVVIAICLFIGTVASAQNTSLGKRYQVIDNEVESVSTRFEKVEVTTSRTADGKVVTRIRSADGKAAGRALVSQTEKPLDAVNADRYLGWKDGELAVRKRFEERELGRAAGDILEVTTRTRTLEAFSRRGLIGGRHEGKELPAFTSVLRTADGKEDLGRLAWFAENQVLVFQMKWDAEPYYVTADVLPEGWTFQPNMAWANIQLISFAKSHDDIVVHKAKSLTPLDDVGCTGLHWLDGGVLRPCCDIHDQCYYKNGCTFRSWWFQGSWSCVACNIEAVLCMTLRTYLCEYTDNCPIIGWRGDWGGGGTYDCYIEGSGWCPAYCRACGRV